MRDHEPLIDELLGRFRQEIGVDLEKYSNHVYRVFETCLMRDANPENRDKYAIAAVFHDIGIWTDHTIDYLPPSILQAELYLKDTKQEALISEITDMIFWHHKVRPYRGAFSITAETFRKADWTDVSLGVLTFGANRKLLSQLRQQFPNAGFHVFLLQKIGANFFRHPLNPLPMFKK
ncbi:HD domain-containing protein [Dyadobacter sp. CY261]|uniref:HD domain-containing protein n=1 Tax=Dyadobacter sp. CY261 TaxID=2907203 RepID=UPI001F3AA73D|nr:HD domain-containing protein [Dyadobacter sp. CY261]MCF0073941.1 HD domain-containing protein [Dyadobacter sp. CY261]